MRPYLALQRAASLLLFAIMIVSFVAIGVSAAVDKESIQLPEVEGGPVLSDYVDLTEDGLIDMTSPGWEEGLKKFNVDNYKEYLSLQCDSALRDIVRIYPYDVAVGVDTTGDGQADEGSLRGSSEIVAERIRAQIQEKVQEAGLEIIEARITYLAYAPEIAAVMLQRQQATAMVAARHKIVEGAVGMVQMALEQLSEKEIIELDEENTMTAEKKEIAWVKLDDFSF